jgi:hypothetical protein
MSYNGALSVSGGAAKATGTGLITVWGPPTQGNPPGPSTVVVRDILTGQAYNPSTTSNVWGQHDAIVFESNTIYEVDGADPVSGSSHAGPADNTEYDPAYPYTETQLNVSMTRSGGFFQQDGDKLRVSINWRDYSDGRLVIVFQNKNVHDGLYDRTVDSFGAFQMNTAASPNYKLQWIGYKNDNSALAVDDLDMNQATQDLLLESKTNDAEPLVLELERLNNSQISATLLDYNLTPVSGQSLTCNESTDTFVATNVSTNNNMTNNDQIFVGDITHITLVEVSNSAVDLKVQLNP